MRHDAERPETSRLISEAPVPGHWIQVLATMRANTFTRLSLDDIRAEATHILIVSPTAEVARTCFPGLLDDVSSDSSARATDEYIEMLAAEEVVPEDVPAGTWVFLPHRQDGWTELEDTSARVRAALVKENTTRDKGKKITLIEYGINLWLWAEPPYGGGDPVCHAGELISWESAWALIGSHASAQASSGGRAQIAAGENDSGNATVRPPIYFGLPDVLRTRRRDG